MFLRLVVHEVRSFDLGSVSLTDWPSIIWEYRVGACLGSSVSRCNACQYGVAFLRDFERAIFAIASSQVLCVLLAISFITVGSRQAKD